MSENEKSVKKVADILCQNYGLNHDEGVTDLITDIIHFCNDERFDLDFEEIVEQCRSHYAHEVNKTN
jgi:hypothetical protein